MTEPTEPPHGHHNSSGTEGTPAGPWEGQQPAQPSAWEGYSQQSATTPEHDFSAPGAAYSPGAGYPYGGPVTGSMFPGMPPLQTGGGPKRRGLSATMVAVALLGGVIGGGVGVGGTLLLTGRGDTPVLTQHDASPGTQPVAQAGSVQFAAGKALSSTVDIAVASRGGGDEGTGVILTPDGYVLTNNHVVSSGGQITVTLPGERKVSATVVGVSPSYDLAVLKLGGVSGLTPAELGRSSNIVVGQTVVAVGSPLGLEGTVTSGIVSALNRTVQVNDESGQAVVYNGLQTDASINPGNSGGPLVNLDGQVIGINSSIQSTNSGGGNGQAGNIGLGFSIPIDTASRVANEIIQHGTANKPQLGITGTNGPNGEATVSQVLPGSAASKANLMPGETILKVNDQNVNAFTDLVARISAQTPGATVTLTVADGQGNNPHPVQVTLGSVPDKAADTTRTPGGQGFPGFGGGNGSPFGGGGGGPFGGGGNGGGGFGGGGG